MKKIFKFSALAMIAAPMFFTNCNSGAPKPSLKTDVDTLSYEMGMASTNGIEAYLQQAGIDSAYIKDFLRGVKDGSLVGDNKKQQAYYAGVQIGVQIKTQMFPGVERMVFSGDSTKTLSLKNYLSGFFAGVNKNSNIKINNEILTPETAGMDANQRMQAVQKKNVEEKYGENKKLADEFMQKKAADSNYKKLPSGVLYKVIKQGSGVIPSDTSTVEVQYEGSLIDGKVFDSTAKNNGGKAVPMRVDRTIPGFTEALKRMPVGSIWEIIIPYDQAYGEAAQGPIPPYSVLIFKLQLEKVK